ncbi:response regulator [Methylacidiphilales bacterium]|nr:response regulator [Candidatus Methylacidiphilales bacterium]
MNLDDDTNFKVTLSRRNLRILLVDDDDNDSELLRAALIETGFTHHIGHFRNGAIALEYFKYTKATGSMIPHVLLLDLNMPLIDGVRALRRLREASSVRDLPVIILTGTDNPATRCELAHLGIFRFLKKEPNFANVIAALADFISLYNRETTVSMGPRIRDRISRNNLKSSRLGYFRPRRSRG